MTEKTKGEPPSIDWFTETFYAQVEHAVKEGDDVIPSLFLGNAENGNSICPLHMIHAPTFQEVVRIAVSAMHKQMGKPDWIALTSDTYVHAPIERDAPHPGDLQVLFKEGSPNVRESAMLHYVKSDGTGCAVNRMYKRNGNEIEWGQERRDDFTADVVKLGGGLPGILLDATKWSDL